ncbi:MAG: hypothetical protein QHC67_17660 [Sphingobium sp.]|uniref:hypothetical protein n=1 Tax=Sphingobium sp. TaxID=1912891 RepID=UPI0029BA205A|nr:hypothetical protein [Sphingobium sp.]MDX3911614.1 hypothetical protein [Sphingobium sp.]
MGLDDRDYMRARYRERRGLGATRWNDRKSRVEHDGAWFAAKNRGFEYQKNRWRPRKPDRWGRIGWALAGLAVLVGIAIPAWRDIKLAGWLPDTETEIPFPASGSVTVNRSVDPKSAISHLRIIAARGNALVQLYDPGTAAHVISVYARRNADVAVPVPPGTYRVRIVEGDKWHGGQRYFGISTVSQTVSAPVRIDPHWTRVIDLHRSRWGNLRGSADIRSPKPLD